MSFRTETLVEVFVLLMLTAATVITFYTVPHISKQKTDRDTDHNRDVVLEADKFDWNRATVPERFMFSQYTKYNVHEEPKVKVECGTLVTLGCEACILFIAGLKELVAKGFTQKDILKYAIDICIDFEIEDSRVCRSICLEYEDELFGVAKGLVLSPEEACSVLIGSACGVPYDPTIMWNVTLPNIPKPPVMPPKPPKPASPILRVLHLTDMHLDLMYKEGSNAVCGEPLCCRADDGKPAKGVPGAGKYGDYRSCDSAPSTVTALFKHLYEIQDQFDYVIFTGDLPAHNVWNQSQADQLNMLEVYTNLLKKYLPEKRIFNAVGNHESAPVNSFPPPFITGKNSITWLYEGLAKSWQTWLPNNTIPDIIRGAFYTVSPFPGFRIVSLNMNYCNNGNWWLLLNTTDPAEELEWLINVLQKAENNKEKVHILGHMYPGSGSCLKAWSWNYYKIVNRYESTIAAQFFGHSHMDFFEVIYDDVNFTRPVSTVLIPGSITTFSQLNPGYRIYEIDGNYQQSSWAVLDFKNYYLNLTDANKSNRLQWTFEYGAKSTLGMDHLYPANFNNLIYRMKDNDTLFQNFYSFYLKMAPANLCEGDCKKNLLCDLKTGRSHDPSLCKDLK